MSIDFDKLCRETVVDTIARSFYRQSNFDTPVRVAGNNSAARFNNENSEPTQYFSGSITGVWAEVLRRDDLRTDAEASEIRDQIYEVHVECSGIVDLSTFEKITNAGLDPAEIVSDDHSYCRALADGLRAHGCRGILSPSAAYLLPGEVTLALFGARVDVDWETVDTQLRTAIRARPVMQRARPPAGLTDHVRFYGEPHRPLHEFLKRR